MPSVSVRRPKIARPAKGLAVVRPQPKAQVTSFMPGLGSMWSSFGPAADQVARRIVVRNPRQSTWQNMARGVRYPARQFAGLEGAGLGAVEHRGVVKAGTTGRKPAPRVVRRAPVTSFMPGLGGFMDLFRAPAPARVVRAAVVRRSPVQVTTTRYMAPSPVTLAPRMLPVAISTPPMRMVATYGSVQQMPMMAPSPAGNGRRAASYDDTEAALSTENDDYMDFAAEGEDLGPMENTDEAISTEDREFGGMGGLFDIQVGAGTLALAAIAAYFLVRKRRA